MIPLYEYVGEHELMPTEELAVHRVGVATTEDVRQWAEETGQILSPDGSVTATFIIDVSGKLWIADRHSEHVHCARGGPVQAAGEITFLLDREGVSVGSITNQSTGYCPEPDSWQAVHRTVEGVFTDYPDGFMPAFLFRRCTSCGSVNIVKDDSWECAVCGGELPIVWNLKRAS